MKINIVILIIFLLNAPIFAQNTYYKVNGEKAIDNNEYKALKDKYAPYGKVEEFNLKTVEKGDSIIHYIKLGHSVITSGGADPWSATKKFVGTKFSIEKYTDTNSKKFESNYLEGKPTLINFWFTKCPPCIKELPLLNQLKEKYGDRVNFIAITFDDQKTVEKFLKKHQFDFKHIYNSKKQIEELNIAGYPTSLILDENGIIKIVTPMIHELEIKNIETSLDILLEE